MRITEAKYRDGWLMLATRDPRVRALVYTFKPGEYELNKARKRRSLNANAYCWALCEEIAVAVGLTKEEVYRNAVREVGPFLQQVLPASELTRFIRRWKASGTGWVVDVVGDEAEGVLVHAYFGSSTYDTKEMARLIDQLVQDARALDIETLSERELSLLLDG